MALWRLVSSNPCVGWIYRLRGSPGGYRRCLLACHAQDSVRLGLHPGHCGLHRCCHDGARNPHPQRARSCFPQQCREFRCVRWRHSCRNPQGRWLHGHCCSRRTLLAVFPRAFVVLLRRAMRKPKGIHLWFVHFVLLNLHDRRLISCFFSVKFGHHALRQLNSMNILLREWSQVLLSWCSYHASQQGTN
jgi:hypothetical protein